jgi:epoxyqueuosine reductase
MLWRRCGWRCHRRNPGRGAAVNGFVLCSTQCQICDYVCGGFTGLHKSGKWSTWSPGRFPIPDKDEDFYPALLNSVGPYLKRPKTGLALFNVIMPGDKVGLTCGNCQLICHPDKEVRKHRYKLLVASGVITQNPDGSLEAVTPEEAQKRIAEMDAETRTLYELAQDPETG